MKFFFGFGVPLFFVVSAFSLAYGYEGKLSDRRQVAEFYLRRLLRIAPLYYLAVIAQLATLAIFGIPQPDALTLLLSFTFLFNLSSAHVDGIAPASWSIGVEMLFYLIFPFVLALARTPPRAVLLTAAFIAVAIAYAMVGTRLKFPPSFVVHGLLFHLPYFGFGLIAHQAYRRLPARWGGWLTAAGLAAVVGVWAFAAYQPQAIVRIAPNVLYQACWGAPFALLCIGMAARPPWLMSNPVTQFLGRISFGVYLSHPHVIGVLIKLGVYKLVLAAPGGSGVTFPLAVLATCAVVIPLSWLLYETIEAPGMRLGRRLSERLGLARSGRAAVA